MRWFEHAIWWQVYPLGFTGAPVRPVSDGERLLTHRLGHLHNWLDHAQQLGTNGLLLGPVFTSSTHGYDTLDHYTVDPRLGEDSDFDALVAACRERGIVVLLDGVFNHVGDQHPLYRAALEKGPDSEEAKLFRIDWSQNPPRAAVFEGHGSLVALNHDEPATAALVADVMRHWLRRGIHGWRLDAAYAIKPEFWRAVLAQVRPDFPEAWFVGEMIHGDYADYVQRSGLDSITQYELWKSIWSSLKDQNFFELDWTLQRHNGWLEHFVPQTFVGNHDVTRIATLVGQERLAAALTVLFTVGGIPSVYYGDERGYTGTKYDRLGGDDEVRPIFPSTPDELSPLGDAVQRLHQDLIGLRRRNPWLVHARTEKLELRNEFYRYRVNGPSGEQLLVQLDLPAGRVRIEDGQGQPLLEV
ncbi:alpha-amylase family protein [Luteococcus sp. Sow4_B9]|uniref:alpha-amylase family protein n=1 Tax=Luteococcus sp. Sow4_B9 TaxID=3438792 RepID=UPI003F95FCE3